MLYSAWDLLGTSSSVSLPSKLFELRKQVQKWQGTFERNGCLKQVASRFLTSSMQWSSACVVADGVQTALDAKDTLPFLCFTAMGHSAAVPSLPLYMCAVALCIVTHVAAIPIIPFFHKGFEE